ncbi:glutathione S-transferase family protein [Salinivibrio sp. ES.052]|uniref:glutathione S-transferase family protein n=1 Tax=Salinivibrio sp. ES.052 TaxID=1882823 RepID=UPI0009279F9A|nr:glutathione S-transferase family protein [Salinivibrio sp. ES.052]SIO35923.1 glutathione S-transferase [Salinivibrio sp. ES.052]
MKVYGHPLSINVQKVMWLIDELDLSIKLEEVDIRHNHRDAQAMAERCPMHQVPVLEDGPNSVWESHTILRYLVACYGNKMWYPDCAFQRSSYERWMDWCLSSFQPVIKLALFSPTLAEDPSAISSREKALDQCRYDLERLDDVLSNQKYLASDRMTLADVAVGSLIHSLHDHAVVTLPAHVSRWYQQLTGLPGYQRWVMQADSTLPA